MGSEHKRRWLLAVMLFGGGLVVGLTLGSGGQVGAEPKANPYARLTTLGKVMSYIERSYVKPVSQQSLIDAAVKGMVSSLDPHSAWYTPEEMAELRSESESRFVGVGLELVRRGGQVRVVAPIDGGPAASAGVLAGDVLVSVNGELIGERSVRQVIGLLRGDAGSEVKLVVRRGDSRRTFTLSRTLIQFDAVVSRSLGEGVGYVRVRAFQEGASLDVEAALEDLSQEPGGLKALVIDVRDNPGGYFLEGVQVADLLLDEGVIVGTSGRAASQAETFKANAEVTRFSGPVALLVNEGSASASEILASALQAHGRAVLIGSKTYGKGSVQTMVDLKDGSALKLTTARYMTPQGRSLEGAGVVPDIEVDRGSSVRGVNGGASAQVEGDASLRRAVSHLKSLLEAGTQGD